MVLTVLFGPLGLFYVLPPKDAFIVTTLSVVVTVLTGGIGLLFIAPMCVIWAYKETVKINGQDEKDNDNRE